MKIIAAIAAAALRHEFRELKRFSGLKNPAPINPLVQNMQNHARSFANEAQNPKISENHCQSDPSTAAFYQSSCNN